MCNNTCSITNNFYSWICSALQVSLCLAVRCNCLISSKPLVGHLCVALSNPNPLFTPLLTWCSVQFSAQKPAAYAAYAYAYAHPVQNNLVWPCYSRNIPEQPCVEHGSKFFLHNIMNWIKVPINKETKSTGNV